MARTALLHLLQSHSKRLLASNFLSGYSSSQLHLLCYYLLGFKISVFHLHFCLSNHGIEQWIHYPTDHSQLTILNFHGLLPFSGFSDNWACLNLNHLNILVFHFQLLIIPHMDNHHIKRKEEVCVIYYNNFIKTISFTSINFPLFYLQLFLLNMLFLAVVSFWW